MGRKEGPKLDLPGKTTLQSQLTSALGEETTDVQVTMKSGARTQCLFQIAHNSHPQHEDTGKESSSALLLARVYFPLQKAQAEVMDMKVRVPAHRALLVCAI